jgi:hypothetical protein
MSSLDIYTYQDAVDHLLETFGVERGSNVHRQARRAVQMAYGSFADMHRWSYYDQRAQFQTVATQTTGTIAYDHTLGTYEREVTLSGATWPTADDVRLYSLIIDNKRYDIEDVKSTTVLTLTSTNNPGADVAAGAAYTLYKSKYHLPINFRKMTSDLKNVEESEALEYVSPEDLLEYMMGDWQPTDPVIYTVKNDAEVYGGWLVELAPPPVAVETWEYTYEASPRPIRTERYATGTVTTDGTTTVTSNGATFVSDMRGAILRVPVSGTTEPGGIVGSIDVSGNTVNRFDVQRSIVNLTSTTLTTDAAISTRAGVGFTISDPVDMEPGMMMT